jgi:hypothetical protein
MEKQFIFSVYDVKGEELLQYQEFYVRLRHWAIQWLWRQNTNETEKQCLRAVNWFIVVTGLNTLRIERLNLMGYSTITSQAAAVIRRGRRQETDEMKSGSSTSKWADIRARFREDSVRHHKAHIHRHNFTRRLITWVCEILSEPCCLVYLQLDVSYNSSSSIIMAQRQGWNQILL